MVNYQQLLSANPHALKKTAVGWRLWAEAVNEHAGDLGIAHTKYLKPWNGIASESAHGYLNDAHLRVSSSAALLKNVEKALTAAYTKFGNAHNALLAAIAEANTAPKVQITSDGRVQPSVLTGLNGLPTATEIALNRKKTKIEAAIQKALKDATEADKAVAKTLKSLMPKRGTDLSGNPPGGNHGGGNDGGGSHGGGRGGGSPSFTPVVYQHGRTTLPRGALNNVNGKARIILDFARQQLGKPYIWGGNGPGGYDCSGLTSAAYAKAGIEIPRTSEQQWRFGPQFHDMKYAQPGDLVFFDPGPNGPGHVGIVLDPEKHTMIVAPHTGTDIQIQHYDTRTDRLGFTRPGVPLGHAS